MANSGRSRGWLWALFGGGAFFIFVLAVYTLVYVTLRGEQGTQYVVTPEGPPAGCLPLSFSDQSAQPRAASSVR